MTRARETSENARLAKAWVNFNDTGTVAIRDDFNVSSITDLGSVGYYGINFVTAMSNFNYALVASCNIADALNPSTRRMYICQHQHLPPTNNK